MAKKNSNLRALIHASEILTGEGFRAKDGRHPQEADVGRIEDGALVYTEKKSVDGNKVPDQIVWVGPSRTLPKQYKSLPTTDLKRRQAVTAGWVDCHTHLVFAGDRAEEFAARCGGATYAEIAARGGGIQTSVRATRQASAAELLRLAIPRLREAYTFGVRTLEIKSGYGLTHESELKVLGVVARLRKLFPEMTLTSTYLGAHAIPRDQKRDLYFREMLERTLPEVARRKLADSCDIFVDEGYYTVDEAQRLLSRARELGLKIKIHADELGNTESAALAARMQCLSADHLLQVSDQGITALATAQTVAVLLPGTAFYLKAAHAPARKLIAAGARVALSTDFNPGTCMTLSLPIIQTIAALYLGMTRAEILAGITYNAACALGLQDRKGTLEVGRDADFTLIPFSRFEECYYRLGWAPAADIGTSGGKPNTRSMPSRAR